MCLSAVAAGTALAWTAPALPQLKHENSTLPTTEDERKIFLFFYLTKIKQAY